MTTITLAGHQLQYTVAYQRNRKTIKIKLASPTLIEITAPTGFSRQSIEEMLAAKNTWLVKQLDKLSALAANPINKKLAHGAQILYLGKPKTLHLTSSGKKTSVTLQAGTITVQLSETSPLPLSAVLFEWYAKNAGNTLAEKTRYWAKLIGVQPIRVTIRDQKTRWGSCSTRGSINYNWRIIMAPVEIIDYLVVHELCHLRHPNHSANFWQLVGQFIPDYKERRHWLRENGGLLGSIF
jgi:predicted metal-dependent hydrolase